MAVSLCPSTLLSAVSGAGHLLAVFAQTPTLTTKDQANGPTVIVDENGNEVCAAQLSELSQPSC